MEIIVLLAIALIVLGPERMPEVIRAVGKIMRELRAASNTVMRELTEGFEDETTTMRPARRVEPEVAKPVPPVEKQ
jgi:Tat protein translocase TatB subunit